MFIWPCQPGLCWNCHAVEMRLRLSRESGVDGGKGVEGGIECFSWAERSLYLADNSYSRVRYCATANTCGGGNKQRLQKRQTNDSTLHSKLFSSYTACFYRATLKVKQSATVYSMCTYWGNVNNNPKRDGRKTQDVIPSELLYWFHRLILFSFFPRLSQ